MSQSQGTMPTLREDEERFLKRRIWLNNFWPWVITPIVFVWLLLWLYIFVWHPMLGNPMHVAALVTSGDYREEDAFFVAGMFPVLLLFTSLLLLAFVMISWAWRNSERKLLLLIRKLQGRS